MSSDKEITPVDKEEIKRRIIEETEKIKIRKRIIDQEKYEFDNPNLEY